MKNINFSINAFDIQNASFEVLEASLQDKGYVILLNVLSKEELCNLHQELDPYFEKRPNSVGTKFWGEKTQRIEALLAKSKTCQSMTLHPLVIKLTNCILGPNCNAIQLNLTQGIKINPGQKAQMIHPDSALFPLPKKPFEFQINAIWAYTDFTKENGATVIVPGSHKWPEGRVPLPEEIAYAEMPAGSVLIYQASLLHGGGENTSNASRTGIAISYCLGWLRQSENQYLSYTREEVLSFPEELQKLIGYSVHRPNLGWVHGVDPIDQLYDKKNNGGAKDFLTDGQNALLEEYLQGKDVSLTHHNLQ